jgi:hypothetical protein
MELLSAGEYFVYEEFEKSDAVAHTCNPRYRKAEIRKIEIQGQPGAKSL